MKKWWYEYDATPNQRSMTDHKRRGPFNAYMRNTLGCPALVKAIISVGAPKDKSPEALKSLLDAVQRHMQNTQKARVADAASAMHAEKAAAMEMRQKFKKARRIYYRVFPSEAHRPWHVPSTPFDSLTEEEQDLCERFSKKKIHREHDIAQHAYGRGLARSNFIIPVGRQFGNSSTWKPSLDKQTITQDIKVWAFLNM